MKQSTINFIQKHYGKVAFVLFAVIFMGITIVVSTIIGFVIVLALRIFNIIN